jgi:hypothetical protein
MQLPKKLKQFLVAVGGLAGVIAAFFIVLWTWKTIAQAAKKKVIEQVGPTYDPIVHDETVQLEIEKIMQETSDEIVSSFKKRFGG